MLAKSSLVSTPLANLPIDESLKALPDLIHPTD
jgi:hypothetical protein